MRKVQAYLEQLHGYLQQDFDMMMPVIGDEGMGKSTLMTAIGWLWLPVVGKEQTVENAQAQIAWDRDQFKTMLTEKPEYSCIIIHDAARVLSRKKAMHGDQIEIEEDLLDARFGNYLVLLGFQEFDLLPTMLATRRSKHLLRVPKRGVVHGHQEENIRKRYRSGNEEKWPEPTFKDTFPDLAGTDVWEAFEAEDQRRKKERIAPDEDDEEEEMGIKELAEHIIEEGRIPDVTSLHGGHNKLYIDPDLVEIEFGTSGQKAKKVAKVLKKKRAQGEIQLERAV